MARKRLKKKIEKTVKDYFTEQLHMIYDLIYFLRGCVILLWYVIRLLGLWIILGFVLFWWLR